MTPINADSLLGDRLLREQYSDRIEVLDEVKKLPVLKGDIVTREIVQDYYEVSKQTIIRVVNENKDELSSVGYKVLKGEALNRFKDEQRPGAFRKLNSLAVFPREAVLRLGMLLSESDVAKEVRSHLVNSEGIAGIKVTSEESENQDINNTAGVGRDVLDTVNAIIKFQHETMQQQNDLLRQILIGYTR